MKRNQRGLERKSLLNNTIMLAMLTGSNYIFGFISVPYLTRVLGPETYGFIGMGNAFYTIVQLVLDFGFLLSGTLEIAKCKEDYDKIQRVFSAVLAAKLLLVIPVFCFVTIIVLNVERFSNDIFLYFCYFAYAACNVLVPDFLYRGLENMVSVTIRNVIVKTVFVVLIFLFVKQPNQYHLVPIFYACGSLVSTITMYEHVHRVLGIHFTRVSFAEIFEQLRKSSLYFLSRIASTVFTSVNTLVMGFVAPTGPTLGCYSATNTTINAGRQVVTPVTDSLFPNIVRTKNYKLMYKVAVVGTLVLSCGCVLVGFFANQLCLFAFGEGYDGMVPMLRIMLPLIPIALLSYLFGWSGLGSIGKDAITNISVLVGAIFHLAILVLLYIVGVLNPLAICASSVATQSLILAIRMFAFFRGLKVQDEKVMDQ